MLDFSKINALVPLQQQEEIAAFLESYDKFDADLYRFFDTKYPDLLTEAELFTLFLQIKHKSHLNVDNVKTHPDPLGDVICHGSSDYVKTIEMDSNQAMQEVVSINGQLATELNKTLKMYLKHNTISDDFKVVDTANHLKMLKEFANIAESLTRGLTAKHPAVLAVQVNNNLNTNEKQVLEGEQAKDLSKLLLKIASNTNGIQIIQDTFSEKDPYQVMQDIHKKEDVALLKKTLKTIKE